jgi:hypothetical protein
MRRTGLGRRGGIEENAGDPLDGLVNLFDVGIVLAIAFLIAGLGLATKAASDHSRKRSATAEVRVLPKPNSSRRARGHGAPVGTAYRLADGRIVIVSP